MTPTASRLVSVTFGYLWAIFRHPVTGIVVGALVTYFVSRHYYVRAGDDLKAAAADLARETQALRTLTTNIARGLEEGGVAEFVKDKDGNITGVVLHLRGIASGKATAKGDLTVTPGKR